MLRIGSALIIKASISSLIIKGYTGSIIREALKALGVLGTSESLLIRLDKEEHQTRWIVILLDKIREAKLISFGNKGE
jgi:hypothetical protein